MNNPRCVVDTNVLISALLSAEGKPNQAVYSVLRHGVLLSSVETFAELKESLNRSKFDRYLRDGDRASYLALIQDTSRFIEITESIEKCRDPDDNKFLELALSGNADIIVSGDDDLLVLHPFRGIPILSPDAFLESEFAEP